jgi:hypothetical protein
MNLLVIDARLAPTLRALPKLFGPDSIENHAMSRWGAASRLRGRWGGVHNVR